MVTRDLNRLYHRVDAPKEVGVEFLPLTVEGEQVFAGFWKRFCAGWVDAFILIPLFLFFAWLEGFDRTLAIAITIPSSRYPELPTSSLSAGMPIKMSALIPSLTDRSSEKCRSDLTDMRRSVGYDWLDVLREERGGCHERFEW